MSDEVKLKDCLKTYTWDQDKVRTPEETVREVQARLAQVGLDIVRKTERIDQGRLDIPVYVSIGGVDALKVMPTKKQMGKGATPAQAEASAVMEMVERYSFFHFVQNEPFIQAPYSQVADQALPFEHLAASVHHDPQDLHRARQALNNVDLSWTPAWNLTRNQSVLVPFSWFYEINEFNGPAAGNTLEEAIMQSLAEVVERHTSALVARGRLPRPSIDLSSLKSEVAQDLVDKFHRHGIKLFTKDFTMDMGLPTVGALAYDPSTFPGHSEIVYTAGTATDPEKAFIRALTEVAQLAGDFNTRANYVASGLPKYTRLEQAKYVTEAGPVVPISTLPNINAANIRVEIETAVAALAKAGFEVYVINITHPRIGVPAVYTIIPGAHFRERAKGSSVPFFAAKILAQQNAGVELVEALEFLDSLYPGSYYLKFHAAQAFIEENRPDLAEHLLREALFLDPPNEDRAAILTYLGLALKDMEQYHQAISVLEQSALIDDERRDTFNLLGFCYFKTKQHQRAIQAFELVLKIDPGSAIDYANIGTNYRELGRRDEAVRYYKTALELDPTMTWVWDSLSKITG